MLVARYFSAMIIVPKQRGRLFFYDETDVNVDFSDAVTDDCAQQG